MTKPKAKEPLAKQDEASWLRDWWIVVVGVAVGLLVMVGSITTGKWLVATGKRWVEVSRSVERVNELAGVLRDHKLRKWSGDHKQDERLDALEQRVKALEEKSKEGQSTIWWNSTNIAVTNYSTPWAIMPNNSTLENITVIPYDN